MRRDDSTTSVIKDVSPHMVHECGIVTLTRIGLLIVESDAEKIYKVCTLRVDTEVILITSVAMKESISGVCIACH